MGLRPQTSFLRAARPKDPAHIGHISFEVLGCLHAYSQESKIPRPSVRGGALEVFF